MCPAVKIQSLIHIWHLHIYIHCTWKTKAEGGLHVPGQPGLYNGTLSLRWRWGVRGSLLVVISSVIHLTSPSELGNIHSLHSTEVRGCCFACLMGEDAIEPFPRSPSQKTSHSLSLLRNPVHDFFVLEVIFKFIQSNHSGQNLF